MFTQKVLQDPMHIVKGNICNNIGVFIIHCNSDFHVQKSWTVIEEIHTRLSEIYRKNYYFLLVFPEFHSGFIIIFYNYINEYN